MKKNLLLLLAVAVCATSCSDDTVESLRTDVMLKNGWLFTQGDPAGGGDPGYDATGWEPVTVPHDWAVYGPFDIRNDLQNVAVTQNFENTASLKTGRTGGLPWVGVGWYRLNFDVDGFDAGDKAVTLYFDGAMSEARVYVNGKEACFWPNGYNAFHCDITGLVNQDGRGNVLAVRLENRPESSRWYPGAGLYRNVRLITTSKAHIPVWGTYITTPEVTADRALVDVRIETAGDLPAGSELRTDVYDGDGKKVASGKAGVIAGEVSRMEMKVGRPRLWSPESPELYTAVTRLVVGGKAVDTYETRFGIRSIEYINGEGFKLNGVARKFQGVCNHHDLGALGAAVNTAALRYQLTLLKDMGCDAVRTAHNMPATELVDLCDEMGLMVMVEPFDEWDVAKCANGYHRYFAEWAEKDMVNMLRHFRNNPSVVMWSIGNEVPTQRTAGGKETAAWLQSICHREDPTRPVTCGMDQVKAVLENGFAAVMDVPGLNYRTHFYEEAHRVLPDKLILGSETASTVSSRGVYKFPVEKRANAKYEDHQSSGYDVEHCAWSNIPDEDFALADDHDWTIGQFVWTGFDYLGEPSPYDVDSWPSHSSVFGIIDLAGIPKDRYWLYRSLWNKRENTLHVLPHWTWHGREGEVTPVFVYTNFDEAELFVNGVSQGRRKKNDNTLLERYRLMWNDVVYQPGEIKMVVYDGDGEAVMEKVVLSAGEPHAMALSVDRDVISADGEDLAYVRVKVVDADGNPCPGESRLVGFEVEGAGFFRASANGDPTCLYVFHEPEMPLFSGELAAIVQSNGRDGVIKFTAKAEGLQSASIEITAQRD